MPPLDEHHLELTGQQDHPPRVVVAEKAQPPVGGEDDALLFDVHHLCGDAGITGGFP